MADVPLAAKKRKRLADRAVRLLLEASDAWGELAEVEKDKGNAERIHTVRVTLHTVEEALTHGDDRPLLLLQRCLDELYMPTQGERTH